MLTQIRIHKLLQQKFTQVEYCDYAEAERAAPAARWVIGQVFENEPVNMGNIMLDYLTDNSAQALLKRDKLEEYYKNHTLLSMLDDWIQKHEQEENKKPLIPLLRALSTLAQRKLKEKEDSPQSIDHLLFLTLELLDGNISPHDYKEFAKKSVNPHFAKLADNIAQIFMALALLVAVTIVPSLTVATVAAGVSIGLVSYGLFATHQYNKKHKSLCDLSTQVAEHQDGILGTQERFSC